MATIMVVEDNEYSRDALARRLERRGYQIVLATDGQQAVAVAHTARPDLDSDGPRPADHRRVGSHSPVEGVTPPPATSRSSC